MGLSICGCYDRAVLAYKWLRDTQLADGSWWSATQNGNVIDSTKDTNLSTYVAVGVFHHYLITSGQGFSGIHVADGVQRYSICNRFAGSRR